MLWFLASLMEEGVLLPASSWLLVQILAILQAPTSVPIPYWSIRVHPALGSLQPLNLPDIIVWTFWQLIKDSTSLGHLPYDIIIKFKPFTFPGAKHHLTLSEAETKCWRENHFKLCMLCYQKLGHLLSPSVYWLIWNIKTKGKNYFYHSLVKKHEILSWEYICVNTYVCEKIYMTLYLFSVECNL